MGREEVWMNVSKWSMNGKKLRKKDIKKVRERLKEIKIDRE